MLIIRFLWVDLQFEAILEACEEDGTPDRIPDLFESPPRKITQFYGLALVKLSNEDEKLTTLAKKVFQWVVCSRRPLTIRELEEAVSITTDQKSWANPPFKLDISKLCRICGNLIKYNKASETVSLAHHSVLSFLLSCSNTPGIVSFAFEEYRAEQYLTDICLTYLSFTDFHKAIIRTSDTTSVRALNQPLGLALTILPTPIRRLASVPVRRGRFGQADRQVDMVNVLRSELSRHQSPRHDPSFHLLEYCKAYWHNHSLYVPLGDIKRFETLETFVRGTHFPPEWKPWSSITDQKSLPHWKIFLWAVREGHTVIFCIWQNIVKMHEANYWDHLWLEEGKTLFASACATANFEQLEIILGSRGKSRRAARPSVDEIKHELVKVSHLGHSEVVERLLQEKADVNAADYSGRTALQAAAGGGHLAVMERLLQEKADVNAAAAKYSGRTALQAAAEGGHLAVVERLLQEKADVNAVAAAADYGRTALQAAAEGGHLAVVERLLQEKADVNAAAAADYGRTALQAAAGGGHLIVVEQLLQEKANVNVTVAKYNGRTALQAAAEGGHLAVVERLLQEKADVNAAAAPPLNGRTALQAAAGGGYLAIVERLLQEKAVNTADYGKNIALQAAAEGGYLSVVERLLQEKADVNATDSIERRALQVAAERGHLAVVERLLQEKADVNAIDSIGTKALQVAAEGGHLAVVERLLQEKANVNATDFMGRKALQLAAERGHLAVVERLLQEEADVNAASVNGRTALQAAGRKRS